MITTQIIFKDTHHFIELFYEGEKAGYIEFTKDTIGNIDIEHTIVDSNFGGKGLGKELVLAAVEYAKKENIKIKTSCPFAKKVFEKTEEIQEFWFN